ncbi:MAG TPA: tyrosine-type recombinase/integrase [Patescibacteria group bacterium]|nr:tyrosine-type recombinase/integrase [Patescibacteria group bacterium]
MANIQYVQSIKDRYGRWRHYYRRKGFRQALDGQPGTPEFLTSYTAVHSTFEGESSSAPKPGTFGAMVTAYLSAPEFTQLRGSTQDEYRRHIEDARLLWSDIPLAGITKKVVLMWRNSRSDRPTTANRGVETLRTLFKFGLDYDLCEDNPAKTVKSLRIPDSDGWAPWPKSALLAFADQSEGAARIAFYLALFTGQRRADVLAMRWDDIESGGIHVKQEKTNQRVWVPIHPLLAEEMAEERDRQTKRYKDRAAKGQAAAIGLTIVQKRTGEAYTDDGFGTIWNREQTRLGIKRPFHGLRKNATVGLLEAGCTAKLVQSITGHATMEMVELYGRRVNQKKLAREAMTLLTSSCFLERDENDTGDAV